MKLAMSLRLAVFAIAVTVGQVSPAAAQNYPSRPVTMVVPFPPVATPTSWRARFRTS